MNKGARVSIFLLRISLGWLFIYSGATKILNPQWSAEAYLKGAKTFPEFFSRLASPDFLPIVNIVNEWGQLVLGISLVLGLFVGISSLFGAALMLFYYFPVLNFPYAGEHSYLVDEHIIYALVLIFFALARAGRVWGIDKARFRKK